MDAIMIAGVLLGMMALMPLGLIAALWVFRLIRWWAHFVFRLFGES